MIKKSIYYLIKNSFYSTIYVNVKNKRMLFLPICYRFDLLRVSIVFVFVHIPIFLYKEPGSIAAR